MRASSLLFLTSLWAALAGCRTPAPALARKGHLLTQRTDLTAQRPRGFPAPPHSGEDSSAKVLLGRYLFYDTRLSQNQTYSCASCHQQSLAFTDGRQHAIGSTGEEHIRNTMTLTNVGYESLLTSADPRICRLEEQLMIPLTRNHPTELGFELSLSELVARITTLPLYQRLFAAAFPDDSQPIALPRISESIAAFERTLISGGSPYDRLVHAGDAGALSSAAWRGMRLFFSARTGCSECHGGNNFNTPKSESAGLYRNTGTCAVDSEDGGLYLVTHDRADLGRFRIPTLRNVEKTAPYMHDGSLPTLEAVVEHYAAGGPAMAGQRVELEPFALTRAERSDLVEFLRSLTDEKFCSDPALADPFVQPLDRCP